MLAPEIILNTLDIVFPKVCSRLHLDKYDIPVADIADAMKVTDFNGDRFAGAMMRDDSIESYFCLALHDVPMFCALFMALV